MRAAIALCLSLIILPADAPAQGQRTYDGSESAALRCANTLALTAMALSSADLISDVEKEVMLGVTVLILERHVGGSWRQKKKALAIMRDRRTVEETLDDYRRNAPRCLRQFSIN